MATALLLFPSPSTPTFSLLNRNAKISFPPRVSLPSYLNPDSIFPLSAVPSTRPLPPVSAAAAEEIETSSGDLLDISKLGISEQIVSALSRRGITELFPIQRAVLVPAMEGRDMIGRAITGSGKTLAFGIPILDKIIRHQSQHRKKRVPSALVLAPTRELARQVQQEFKVSAPNLSSTCLYGGISISNQVRTLGYGIDIVVGTPGRIIDLVERGALDLSEVKFVVLDEADQMLAIGFQEDVECILGYLPVRKQCMLFSATMPSWVNNLSRRFLRDPIVVDLVGNSDQKLADGITLYSVASAHANKQNLLATLVSKYAQGGKSIIFTKTKKDAESLSRSMRSIIGSKALHGDMQQLQRDRTLSAFRDGKFNVLVATDVAARGLDIPNVDLVIHYEMPNSVEFFVHRSGRTGRAGNKGSAILMFTESQRHTVRSIERELGFKFEELRGITASASNVRQVENFYELDDEIMSRKSRRSEFSYDRPSGNYGRPRGLNTSRFKESSFRGKSSYGSKVSDTRTQRPKYRDYFDNEESNSQPSPKLYDNNWNKSERSSRLYDNERSRSQESPRLGGWPGRSKSLAGMYGGQKNQQEGMKQRSASQNTDFDFDELLDLFKDQH